jgi:hypothetical protein
MIKINANLTLFPENTRWGFLIAEHASNELKNKLKIRTTICQDLIFMLQWLKIDTG